MATRRIAYRLGSVGRFAAIGAFVLFILVPLYWMIITSIKPTSDYLTIPPVWFPREPTLVHYTAALFSYRGLQGLLNSLIIASASTVLSTTLGTMMAYSIARFDTGGQHLAFWVLSQRFLPPVAIILPIFLLFRNIALYDTHVGLILLYTVFTLPLTVWMMSTYFRQLPRSLEEAAMVDGLSRWQALWLIAVPLAAPGIVAAAIFCFIAVWTEFFFALILTSRYAFTLPTIFRAFLGFQGSQYGEAAALAATSLVPSIALGMLVQRHLVRGLTLGAIADDAMATVTINGLHKHFGAVHAVRGIDLAIPDGEFTVLVGPSGCGKSTLLRAIAGLEEIDAGTIAIDGEVVNAMRPRDRDVAMVFQDYALYPHMTARSNIGLSLRARGMPKPEVETRVRRVGEMLGIAALLDRYPRQLSGGQRQRVAIGRAIVRNPRVFLFDEPLSNLDAQLRDEMRGEIKRLHQEISTTMIYVTHDQIEAMTLADRIVLMREGVIEQQGAPLALFEQPANLFVAGFLGSPKMNFLGGRLVGNGGALAVRLGDGAVTLDLPRGRGVGAAREGASVVLGLRPEHAGRAAAAPPADGIARVTATIDLVQPTGSRTYATFRLAGERVVAELQAHDVSNPGEEIAIDINLRRASLFDPDSGRTLQ